MRQPIRFRVMNLDKRAWETKAAAPGGIARIETPSGHFDLRLDETGLSIRTEGPMSVHPEASNTVRLKIEPYT